VGTISTWGLTSTLLGLYAGQGGESGYTVNTEIYLLNYLYLLRYLYCVRTYFQSNSTSINANTQAIIPQMLSMC